MRPLQRIGIVEHPFIMVMRQIRLMTIHQHLTGSDPLVLTRFVFQQIKSGFLPGWFSIGENMVGVPPDEMRSKAGRVNNILIFAMHVGGNHAGNKATASHFLPVFNDGPPPVQESKAAAIRIHQQMIEPMIVVQHGLAIVRNGCHIRQGKSISVAPVCKFIVYKPISLGAFTEAYGSATPGYP